MWKAAVILAALGVGVWGVVGPARGDVTVSAAISMQAALEKARPALEKAAGEPVSFNFGASGTLAGQIREGAPVDLFISADRENVTRLVAAKAADAASVTVVATNTLVLITPAKNPAGVKGFADLLKPAVERVAVGEPKVVPAGAYAKEALTKLGLWKKLEKQEKLVMAVNVAQVLVFVERDEVEAGVVYATDAALAGDKVQVAATADASSHEPIEYVSVVVTASQEKVAAAKVQKALTSAAVQKVMARFGFGGTQNVKGEKGKS